jgi:uncharacterized protein (TIGR03067 family)
MKRPFRPWILLFVFLVTLTLRGAEDLPRFAGTWRMAQAQMAGKMVAADALKGVTVKVDDASYQVTMDRDPTAEPVERGTFSLQPEAQPKAITLKVTAGQGAGKTVLAIYEFEGDKLRVCYDLSGTKRPTEFKSEERTAHYLVTYERPK